MGVGTSNYTIACVWRLLCSFENRLVKVDHDQLDSYNLGPSGWPYRTELHPLYDVDSATV